MSLFTYFFLQVYFLIRKQFLCSLVQTNLSGREKETFQCLLVTYSLLRSTMIAGAILIVFNLLSSLAVVMCGKAPKKKPERESTNSEPKYPYTSPAVNPDNVKSSKFPIEKYKSPEKQMFKVWIAKEAKFEAEERLEKQEKKIANIEDTKSCEVTNIRMDLEGKCRSLANLQKVLDETKQELMVKAEDSANFMNNLTDASSLLGGLKVDLAEARDNIATLETELEQRREQTEEMRRELDRASEEKRVDENVKQLQTERNNLQEQIQSLESEVTSYQASLEEKTSLVGSLETEVATFKQSVAELEASVESLDALKKEAEDRILAVEKEKSAATDNFESELEQRQQQTEEMRRELDQAAEDKQAFVVKAEQLEAEKVKLQADIASLELKVSSYQTELEEKTSVATFFETGASDAKRSIAELEETVRNIESQKKKAEEAFQKRASTFEKEIEDMKSEMKDMEETMEVNEQKRQEAVLEKQRLEEKQRLARKLRQERGEPYKARYFEQIEDEDTGEVYYKLSRDYWEDRANRDWHDMPDLFSYEGDDG